MTLACGENLTEGSSPDAASGSADEGSRGDGDAEATGAEGGGPSGDGGQGDGAQDGPSGEDGSATTGGPSGTGDDAGDDSGEGGEEGPTDLPTPTGACPTFASGDLAFSPEGVSPRSVRIWISEAAETLDGPLVFYWHGTGSSPFEAGYGLRDLVIEEITSMGGVVAAPASDAMSGQWPWYLVSGMRDDDLRIADEVLACARETVGIDERRIHSIGMSAGGLQTTAMSFLRSNYIASVATYSGGFLGQAPPKAEPENKFAAMIFHGGQGDVVVISFQDASEQYRDALRDAGHFAFICNHGAGHTIPQAQSSVLRFFLDHPWGTEPSPYVDGLPEGFPSYCSL